MMYYRTPDGEPTGNLPALIPSVINPQALTDAELAEHAVALRQLGVMIPDDVLIDASRLQRKSEIIKRLMGDQDSPEAQMRKELEMRAQQAEVARVESDAQRAVADAQLKSAKAQKEMVLAGKEAVTPPEAPQGDDPMLEQAKFEYEAALKEREFERDTRLKFMELGLKREEQMIDAQLKAQDMAIKRQQQAAMQARQQAQMAQQPQKTAE